ncbi:glutathione S-transferase N-terminal domain-containing protein [Sandaracinobacteroides saxicola]|uniref:Glutathione S-transferase N-terminal domain-containing protein n=1 Tax=Sandaracinobacteroides saxicola TaxID=2759707 RepID=A0A7G5IGT5_9SPHN|nr:glutathione binding-like protein [Sandaracinobacteroides saxicola]QMW22577.1 glutathione S-transferase N-terminal domain-containing protein [Sandaracinobacteroides saxicola]
MIHLHYWPTPNGHKVTLFLEEAALPYTLHPVNIREGDQFKPAFLKIAPNNRMPAIEDDETGLTLFESGAILLHLAEKTGRFLATDPAGRAETLQWLFWQMAGLGPMMGQAGHFRNYAPEPIPYALERYTNETLRLLKVMDKRLADRAFLAGDDYSIADMASYPWAMLGTRMLPEGTAMPNLARWVDSIAARPATARAYALAQRPEYQTGPITEDQKKALFHQNASTVR